MDYFYCRPTGWKHKPAECCVDSAVRCELYTRVRIISDDFHIVLTMHEQLRVITLLSACLRHSVSLVIRRMRGNSHYLAAHIMLLRRCSRWGCSHATRTLAATVSLLTENLNRPRSRFFLKSEPVCNYRTVTTLAVWFSFASICQVIGSEACLWNDL